jgi:hypothetical protein
MNSETILSPPFFLHPTPSLPPPLSSPPHIPPSSLVFLPLVFYFIFLLLFSFYFNFSIVLSYKATYMQS